MALHPAPAAVRALFGRPAGARRRSAGALALATVLGAACAVPSSGAPPASPPPATFLYNQQFRSGNGALQATVDREVYPAHYVGLWHTHPGYGMFCTLEGTLTIEVRGQASVPLPAGRCWEEVPGTIHRPANRTDQPAAALFYLLAPAGLPRISPAPPAS